MNKKIRLILLTLFAFLGVFIPEMRATTYTGLSLISPSVTGTESNSANLVNFSYAGTIHYQSPGNVTTDLDFDIPVTISGSTILVGNGLLQTMLSSTAGTLALGGTTQIVEAPPNSFWIGEGDSTVADPSGYPTTSWFALLMGAPNSSTVAGTTGTSAYPYFRSGVGWYDGAVGGALIGSGTYSYVFGLSTTGTTSWTGSVTTLTLTGAPSTPGGYSGITWPIVVTGPNIALGTTCTISGNVLTLSQPTTGSSGGTVSIHIGGNDVLDRLPLYYKYRPALTGSACYVIVSAGLNNLHGSTVVTTSTYMEAEAIQISGTLNSWGETPVFTTLIPTGKHGGNSQWWTTAQDYQRQLYNTWLKTGNLPNAKIIDLDQGFEGDTMLSGPGDTNWTYYDSNGIHPSPQANTMIAAFVNSEFSARDRIFRTLPIENEQVEFTQGLILDGPIQLTGSQTQNTYIVEPALNTGSSVTLNYGTSDKTGYNQAGVGLLYSGSNNAEYNVGWDGISNCYPLYFNAGGNTNTGEFCIGYSLSGAQSTLNGNQKLAIQVSPNTEDGIDMTTTGAYPFFFFSFASQPNINVGSSVNGYWVGTGKVAGNAMGVDWLNQGSNNSHSGLEVLDMSGASHAVFFNSGDFLIGSGTTDNGIKQEVQGTSQTDGNMAEAGTLLVGGTFGSISNVVTLTGTTATTGPGNTSTPALWGKALVNGSTGYYYPLYH